MGGSPYDQSAGRVGLEWGPPAADALLPGPTHAVVVDVLSFTTTVSVAADRGVAVLPWRWRDRGDAAVAFAAEHAAELARGRRETLADGGTSLSPASVRDAPGDLRRLVLPSPNGATTALALADAGAQVVAASLRNRAAVASWLADALLEPGTALALVPGGERWPDGSLRPAVEDLAGAGAVLDELLRLAPDLTCSPEARAAVATWRDAEAAAGDDLSAWLLATSSGRELAEQGWADDVRIAAEVDTSTSVPVLQGTSFVPVTTMRAL